MAVQSIYKKAKFKYSRQYADSIMFPSFTHLSNNQPVEWRVMEWDEADIRYYSNIYKSLQGFEASNRDNKPVPCSIVFPLDEMLR